MRRTAGKGLQQVSQENILSISNWMFSEDNEEMLSKGNLKRIELIMVQCCMNGESYNVWAELLKDRRT